MLSDNQHFPCSAWPFR